MPPSLRLAFALAAALCAPTGEALASNIGVATAVLPAARGTPPAEGARILHVGVDVAADERIETDADGKAHLIFLDGSALTVGPSSDLVLDEYVYDADRRLGRVAISVSRGVLRFVGGGISKKTPVEIRTPTATMGIRGGVAILEVGERVAATFLFGSEMTLSGGGVTQRVDRPGFQIVTDPSGVPQDPIPVQIERLTTTLATLETTRGAGAPGAPQVTDDDVAETQIELLNSTGGLGELEPAAGGGPVGSPLPQPLNVNDMTLLSAMLAVIPSSDDEPPGEPPSQEIPPEETPPEENPPALGTSFPGIFTGRAARAGEDAASGGLALIGGRFFDGRFMAETADGRVLSLVETGSAGQVASNAQPFGPDMLSGTYLALSPQYLLFNLIDGMGARVFAFAGQPTAPGALPGGGVSAYPLFADFVSGRALPFIEDVGPGPPAPGRVYVAWDNSVAGARRAFGGGAVAIFGAGPDQQAASAVVFGEVLGDTGGRPHLRGTLIGQRSGGQAAPAFYSGGVSSSDAGDGADLFGPAANFVLESAAVDATDTETSRGVVRSTVGGAVTAALHAQHATGPPVAQAGARTSRTLTGFAGGVERQFRIEAGGPAQNSAVILSTVPDNRSTLSIQTRANLNTLSASFAFFGSAENLRIGFDGATGGASAFIDDATFFAGGASIARSAGNDPPVAFPGEYAMVTASELQHDGLLPPGVGFCVCEHLVWGFFGGQRNIPPSGGFERWRSLEFATWIAGEPVDPTQIAQVQQATYTGHLIGSVARNLTGGVHQAVGGLSLTFDFAPGSYGLSRLAIDNFDGMSLVKEGGLPGTFGAERYAVAGFTGAHPEAGQVTISMRGAFYGPGLPSAVPANTGGGFTMQGGSYRAAGIFAAARPAAP